MAPPASACAGPEIPSAPVDDLGLRSLVEKEEPFSRRTGVVRVVEVDFLG
jgi:hypothetical protein